VCVCVCVAVFCVPSFLTALQSSPVIFICIFCVYIYVCIYIYIYIYIYRMRGALGAGAVCGLSP
jgi:hypothetical protein